MNVSLLWIFRRLHTVPAFTAVQQRGSRAGLLDNERRQDEAADSFGKIPQGHTTHVPGMSVAGL